MYCYADFLADPVGYEPEAAWVRALDAVAGGASMYAFLRFAESSLHSALCAPDAPYLARYVDDALAALRGGADPAACVALRDLSSYLDELDEASYHLKNRIENLALRAELLPWLELCDLWLDASRRGVRALRARARSEPVARLVCEQREHLDAALAHHKRYAGRVLEPFNRYVLERVG